MTRTALFGLALAACGPAAARPVALSNHDEPVGGHPVPTACPGDFDELARAAWGVGSGTPTASCLALWADGETLWLVDGWFEPDPPKDDFTIGQYSVLVTPDGTVRWKEADDELPSGAMDKTYTDEYVAVDLDGDGNDEVLFVRAYDHGGYTSSDLMAGRIVHGELIMGGDGVPLDDDDTAAAVDPADAYSCTAAHRVVDRGGGLHEVEIDTTNVSGDGGNCLSPGHHVFRWNGTELVEANR